MLRRVARILRLALFTLGIGLLVSIPVSFYWSVSVTGPRGTVMVLAGCFCVWLLSDYWEFGVRIWRVDDTSLQSWTSYFLPEFSRPMQRVVPDLLITVPLWLLAFICLAWPVTSFIVARRRRKGRGFEVEARPGAAAAPPESEAPKVRSNEAQGASPG